MKRARLNGRVFVSMMNGSLKLVSWKKRLNYPFSITDSNSLLTRRIENSIDLIGAIEKMKQRKKRFNNARHLLIRQKIDVFVNSNQRSA